ncbi:unnamed protein product [Onchocerca flexuosa]|uniref:Uncharacterized protein n=1 Tax=Onchocerca flexuosa TaxID=387005 RepID=A0A183I5L6_9BILA|nr:unnamed protein product [Onchocerca flexuosa]
MRSFICCCIFSSKIIASKTTEQYHTKCIFNSEYSSIAM